MSTSGGVCSAIPLREDHTFTIDEDDDCDISLLTFQSKYPASHQDANLHDTPSAFVFGLRAGFSSQVMMGVAVLCIFDERTLSSITENWTNMAIVTALWSFATISMAMLSIRLFNLWNSQDSQQALLATVEQEQIHLFQGISIGMYLSWVLFDLVWAQGICLLAAHSMIAFLGHFYLQRTKARFHSNATCNSISGYDAMI